MPATNQLITICPWLGSRHDQDTPYNYATGQNFCYSKKKQYPPTKDAQTRYCLVVEHVKCPFFVQPSSQTNP